METQVVRVLSSKGVNVLPFKLNYTVKSVQAVLNFTMDVDMLSHFDKWQRLGHDDDYEAQDQWPVELRRARLISAVDYIQVPHGSSVSLNIGLKSDSTAYNMICSTLLAKLYKKFTSIY